MPGLWIGGALIAAALAALAPTTSDAAALAARLATVALVGGLAAAAIRGLAGRALGAEFGPWRTFGRRAAATALAAGLAGPAAVWALGGAVAPGAPVSAAWAAAAAGLAVLILAQVTAEELAFRGYLLRTLAGWFASPWAWAALPAALFAALHLDPGQPPTMRAAQGAAAFVVGLALAYLAWRGAGLALAIGAHLGANLTALLAIGAEHPVLGALAAWRLTDAGPTLALGVAAAQFGAAIVVVEIGPVRRWLGLPPLKRSPNRASGRISP